MSRLATSETMMPDDPISFDINGLYILLSDLGSERQFHWAFYLAKDLNSGPMYHVVNNADTQHQWQYISRMMTGTPKDKTLLVALKIAMMDPVLHDALGARLDAVSITPAPVTCRIWLKRALEALDDEGYIQLIATVDDVELEAEMMAVENRARRLRTVATSKLGLV
ncbi:hypothetical protein BDW59DRAFT_64592 [Aspergillus cavernicola]|uniref:Uncharacterized protein n=1 Tax=Aspergillus cavernicola TaxID=176166 RepID=A0ABR4J1R7_9EURO